MYPTDRCYTTEDLLIDACKFFDVNPKTFCFRDDLNNIYPLITPVKEVVKFSSKGNLMCRR
jgi:hypothetical protein